MTAPWELGRVRSARDRNWSAEVTVSNGSARVDVWYGVDWIGQWAWDARHGFGERRQGNRRLNDDTKRDLDRALGVLGSETAVKLPANQIDAAVMARLRAPFGCEFIEGAFGDGRASRWRIHDANDDAIASCAPKEEGYARLIVEALNEHFARRGEKP